MSKIEVKYSNSEIKKLFKNVYFIIGTAYAGKSTMIKMFYEKYKEDAIFCGENYIDGVMKEYDIDPVNQPNLCYFDTMSSFDEFVNRTPEEYDNWITGCAREGIPIEINELIKYAKTGKKVFVDTNMPIDILKEISDYDHVCVMLCNQSMSVDKFFERDDSEKLLLRRVIKNSSNPNALENVKNCLKKVNSKEHYNEYLNSGFYVFKRDNNLSLEDTFEIIEKHFKLR